MVFILLGIAALISAAVSLSFGGTSISFKELFAALMEPSGTGITEVIIWKIRIPRMMLAAFVGMGLAASGCVLQGMLRNPLADPYTLGISGGAAFGATLAVITGLSSLSILSLPAAAFVGSLACFYAVYFAASSKNFSVHSLILTGVIFGFIFSSMVLFILAVVSPEKMHSSLIWLMGDLSTSDTRLIKIVGVIVSANKDIRLTLDKVPRIMADLQIAYTQAVMIENGPTPTSASLPPPQPSSEPNLAGKIFQAVHVETKLNAGAAALANRFGASQEEVTAAVKTLQTQKMVKIEVDGLTPYLVPV